MNHNLIYISDKTVWTLFNELVNSPVKLLVNQLKITATYE